MWAWRVLIPGLGLAACLIVAQATTRPESWAARALAEIRAPEPSKVAPARPSGDPRVVAEGRIAARPGAEITVGTEAGGIVLALPVAEKAAVRKGDLLVEFVADDQKAALAEAEAKQAEAEAEFAFQNGEFQRRSKAKTEPKQFVADLEGTRRDLAVADARRRQAGAGVTRARMALARARVLAPIDGVVLARHVEPSETVAPGSRLVTVCDLTRVRVEAEVDEFDAGRIAIGDLAKITAEGQEGQAWAGRVEEVPDRVAERGIRPEDPGRATDTRVLLVKVVPDKPLPLKLGQRVEVEIRPKKADDQPH